MKIILKLSTFIISICFLMQNSYSQQSTSGWYWLNSQPQAQALNWVKIVDPTHYYAVGEQGVFMKSTDGGDSWLINSNAGVADPSFGSGATLRLYSGWFFNANTGYVTGQSVSNDGGIIRRTVDGGNTFTDIGLGIPSGLARVNDIYFINATTGYLCGNNVVKAFKTTDAGLSWEILPNLPGASNTYSCIYAIDQNNIFLGESSGRKMLRTTDAGSTWFEDILPGTVNIDFRDIVFQNSSTGYVGGNPNYFAYTTNGGVNWTQAVSPTTQQGMYGLELIGSTVYALGSYTNYYSTTNFGVTWNAINFNDPSNIDQPALFVVYGFSISGNDAIVVGANGKVNISNDGGTSWRNKNYSVGNNIYPYSSVCALPGTGQVWAGSNGGGKILYSTNRGVNWTQYSTTITKSIYDLEMKNSSTGYATGGDYFSGVGFCFKTTNSGVNWTALTIPTPNYQMNSASFIDENTGWIVGGLPIFAGGGAEISKTTNGGANWTSQVTTPPNTQAYIAIGMADANTGYIATFNGTICKTTNGGTNWNSVAGAPVGGWLKIKALSASTVFIGGDQTVAKSFDGGTTWSTVTIPTIANIFSMDWADINNGTVVGTQGYTAKTTDGGVTWNQRNTGSSTLTDVSMVTKDTVYTVCDRNVYGAIFRLIDVPTAISFNLTLGIQGFWNGTTQVSDDVYCQLRNSTAPYAPVDKASAQLNTSGNGTFTFNFAPAGSYYLEIRHRNSIETWSASPQTVVPGSSYNYNFTTSSSQAYGSNMILKSGKYCIYSGDVNQDGNVNLTDVIDIFNASSIFTSGYVVTDVNGDNIVDLTDIAIAYNNSSNFVAKVTP